MANFSTYKPPIGSTNYPTLWNNAMDEMDTRLPSTGTTTFPGKVRSNTTADFGSAFGSTGMQVWANSVYGAGLGGFGSTYDFALFNRSGGYVARNPAGTTNFQMAGSAHVITGLGIGPGGADGARAIFIDSSALAGTSQIGVQSALTGTTAATSSIRGFMSSAKTAAAAFTVSALYHFLAEDTAKGAGSTITTVHGFSVGDLSQGGENIGYRSGVSSGTGKWNLYVDGTAPSYIAAQLRAGSNVSIFGAQIEAYDPGVAIGAKSDSEASSTVSIWNTATAGDNDFVTFATEGGSGVQRGKIDYNRAGGLTRYNTSSDANLKDDLGPVPDVGAFIDSIQIHLVTWKETGINAVTPLAQELDQVAPFAVSPGNGVPEDLDYEPWQWDGSTLIPYMIREIQSLRQRVAQLEA